MKTFVLKGRNYSKHLVTVLTALALIFLAGVDKAHAQSQWSTVTNSPDIYNTNQTGNVGIGTSAPANPLTLVRSGSSPYTTRPAYELLQLVDKTDNTPEILFGSAYNGMWLRYTGTGSTAANQRLGVVTGGAGESFVINNDGNVGVGTNLPSTRLHIAGNNSDVGGYARIKLQNTQAGGAGNTWWLYAGATNVAGAFGLYDETTSSYQMFLDGSGHTGFGTTNPKTKLHVDYPGISAFTGTTPGVMSIAGAGNNYFMALDFRNSDGTTYPYPLARMAMQFTNTGSYLHFGTSNSYTSGITNTALTIDPAGYVGIGNPSPTVKLDINGNTKITGDVNATGTITGGTINATYQDVAEWVPSAHTLAAGTVVVLNPTKTNEVMASTTAYDTRVAGVVSERPGLALGEAGTEKSLVATTGRVKVMVDASKSPIHVGDLLVTSDEEGVAMKSEPVDVGGVKLHRPGTLIGKALEPKESGKGKILVLLSLQ